MSKKVVEKDKPQTIDTTNTKNIIFKKKSLQTLQTEVQMDPHLAKFLSQFAIDKKYGEMVERQKDNHTHNSMIDPKKKYNIDKFYLDKFWEEYQDGIYNKNIICGIGEAPTKESPILIDIDISQTTSWLKNKYQNFDIEKLPKMYTEDDKIKLIKACQDVIKEVLLKSNDKNLICIVLEKKYANIKISDMVSSGIHLHFPFVYLQGLDIESHIIPRIREKIKSLQLFSSFDIKNPENCLDKSTDKHWLLYGSRKASNKEAYKLSEIRNSKLEKISTDETFRDYKLYNSEDQLIEFKKPLEYYLPRILSIKSNNREIQKIKANLEIVEKKETKSYKEVKKKFDEQPIADVYKESKELMGIISIERANEHNSWMEMGWSLYSLGDGSLEFYDLWNEFSSKTSKPNYYDENIVWNHWKKMKKGNYTLGTLKKWAKDDNPKAYESYQRKSLASNINYCIKMGGHNDFAKVLFDNFGPNIVCASIEKDLWYVYEEKQHRWSKDPKGHSLRIQVSDYLKKKFIEARKLKQKRQNELDEEDEEDDSSKKVLAMELKQLNKIIKDLGNAPFKDNVMKECREVFYKRDFLEKLNTNIWLIGFTNGVFDVSTLSFREGRKDDMISLTTGYDYKEYDEDSEEMKIVDDLLFKIYIDKELRQYFMEFCASLLRAGNFRKVLLVMSGIGDNAKSFIINLIMASLGKGNENYATKCPTSLLVGKRNQSSGATPEIYRLIGKRFVMGQEPGGRDQLNIGVCKELTGNDSITTRDLYGTSDDMKEILPLFKLVLVCNNLPDAPEADTAFWNRVDVLPHESKFKPAHECPKTLEEQYKKKLFPKDDTLDGILDKIKGAFMYKMIITERNIRVNGYMKKPAKVMKATNTYKNNNDFYLQFVNESIIEDKESTMKIAEIYELFKEWFRHTRPGQKLPTKNELQKYLLLVWGEPISPTFVAWTGYRYRKEDDDKQIEIELVEESMGEEKKGDDEKKEKKVEFKDDEKRKEKKTTPQKLKKRNEPYFKTYEKMAKGELVPKQFEIVDTDYEDENPERLLRRVRKDIKKVNKSFNKILEKNGESNSEDEKKEEKKMKRHIPEGRSIRKKDDEFLINKKKYEKEKEEKKRDLEILKEIKNYSISEAPL
jgi:P4 family phage/plasmid primase-like protien